MFSYFPGTVLYFSYMLWLLLKLAISNFIPLPFVITQHFILHILNIIITDDKDPIY